ncbi:MAG: hypothetical protein HYS39_00920, partial [Proteobacteria bacterium]|nr:hypothetical protein [Pseudomonadota bacterium]
LAIALYLSGQETKAKELMLRDVKKDDVDENMRLLKELQMSYQVSG